MKKHGRLMPEASNSAMQGERSQPLRMFPAPAAILPSRHCGYEAHSGTCRCGLRCPFTSGTILLLPLFSAGRSRRLTLVPIIQSLAQLEKNYGATC